MPGAGGELSIVTFLHGRRFWLLIPIEVGDDIFNMVLDTGSPFSAISETMRRTLEAGGNVESVGGHPRWARTGSSACSTSSVSIARSASTGTRCG